MKTETIRFGTDGVRDVAGQGALAPASVERLGAALGHWLRRDGEHPGPVLLGGDTRASREAIAGQLTAGLAQAGVEVLDLGVLPTPALALLIDEYGAAASIVISASHNPAADNGIKVFTGGAAKLDGEDARWVERRWGEVTAGGAPDEDGRKSRGDGGSRYLERLREAVPGLDLSGMRVALDLAHGAATAVGPELFRSLGADVVCLGAAPDGSNINASCGALHPEVVAALAVRENADFGLALDGDADRSIFADESGRVVDGDAVLAAVGADLHARGQLPGNTVVGTVMTNFGLEKFLRERGIALERTPVGDKYISSRLREGGFALGGEPSGHLIFGADLSYLGDGLYTALRVAELCRRRGARLGEVTGHFQASPQILLGVRVAHRPPLEEVEGFKEILADAEERLGGEGRVLIRYSGTEPLVRVMAEGPDAGALRSIADTLASFLESRLGAR